MTLDDNKWMEPRKNNGHDGDDAIKEAPFYKLQNKPR